LVVAAFIQARMGSSRFPGKVLAPFHGRPIIQHVLDGVRSVSGIEPIVVLTSDQPLDDPLVDYIQSSGHAAFRGSLHNVFSRFQLCAKEFPADWILRICADSPLLSPKVIREVASFAETTDSDLVTTRFAPQFPKGQNVEMIRASVLREVDVTKLTDHDREHVTPWFYRNPDLFQIAHAKHVEIDLPGKSYTVDTPQDLKRLEDLV